MIQEAIIKDALELRGQLTTNSDAEQKHTWITSRINFSSVSPQVPEVMEQQRQPNTVQLPYFKRKSTISDEMQKVTLWDV